jgi:hypothetical protein
MAATGGESKQVSIHVREDSDSELQALFDISLKGGLRPLQGCVLFASFLRPFVSFLRLFVSFFVSFCVLFVSFLCPFVSFLCPFCILFFSFCVLSCPFCVLLCPLCDLLCFFLRPFGSFCVLFASFCVLFASHFAAFLRFVLFGSFLCPSYVLFVSFCVIFASFCVQFNIRHLTCTLPYSIYIQSKPSFPDVNTRTNARTLPWLLFFYLQYKLTHNPDSAADAKFSRLFLAATHRRIQIP